MREERWASLLAPCVLLCLLFLATGPWGITNAYAKTLVETKHVLVLHSYHAGYEWTDDISRGIRQELNETDEYVVISEEYMDTKRIASSSYFASLYELYLKKYAHADFDVIIAADDNAMRFLQQYRGELFSDVPVVFCGLNNVRRSGVEEMADVTGVAEEIDPAATLHAMSKALPAVRNILVLADQTVTGRTLMNKVRVVEPEFRKRFHFEYTGALSRDEITGRLQNLEPDWAVFFLLFVRDRQEKVLALDEAARLVGAASSVPVFTAHDFNIKHGIVGGMVTGGLMQGVHAARAALRILSGEPASSVPIRYDSPNRYVFDFLALERHTILPSSLPSQRLLLNAPQTAYQQYKREIWAVGALLITLLLVIAGLVVNAYRRLHAEKALRILSQELEERVLARTGELSEANERLEQELDERRIAESALEMSERALRTVLNSVNDGIIIHEQDGTVRDVNSKVLTMYGVSRQEIMVMSIVNDLSGEGNPVETLGAIWNSVTPGETTSFEWKAKRPGNNEEFDVEVALTAIELAGRPMVLATIRDITRRKQQEQKLLRLAMAMEQAADGIFITDAARTLLYINTAFANITGLSAETLIGQHSGVLWQIFPDISVPKAMADTVISGSVWQGQITIQRRSGEKRILDGSYTPMRDDNNEIISYVGVFRDVTENTKLEHTLRQNQRLESLGQLASGVAHAINNPLQYIAGNMEFFHTAFSELFLLLEHCQELLDGRSRSGKVLPSLDSLANEEGVDLPYLTKEVPEALEGSNKGIKQVTAIVAAMKSFDSSDELPQFISIHEALQDVITVSQTSWRESIEAVYNWGQDVPMVECHQQEIRQTFLNIITNAAQAIGEAGATQENKGQIRITTEYGPDMVQCVEGVADDDCWVRVHVEDTGIGIPDEYLERVFDPFFTTRDVGEGTGQGLAFAHNVIVEGHGGTIDITTERGKGTIVTVQLPLIFSGHAE